MSLLNTLIEEIKTEREALKIDNSHLAATNGPTGYATEQEAIKAHRDVAGIKHYWQAVTGWWYCDVK